MILFHAMQALCRCVTPRDRDALCLNRGLNRGATRATLQSQREPTP
jgi:hypothetical protein